MYISCTAGDSTAGTRIFVGFNLCSDCHIFLAACWLEVAMPVVYESPLQVLCDSPYAYRQSPEGLDFLKIVPTTWDETHVISGQVGHVIAIARRSGQDWYVAAMTDWTPRVLEIPMACLEKGRFTATVWQDAPPQSKTLLTQTTIINVTARDSLRADMPSGGGYLVRLTPNP
jgi:alpha-glucosidase